MSTCCPNCSAAALGTDAALLCTECATATVAGASFSLPMLLAGVLAAGLSLVVIRLLVRRSGGWFRTIRPAVA